MLFYYFGFTGGGCFCWFGDLDRVWGVFCLGVLFFGGVLFWGFWVVRLGFFGDVFEFGFVGRVEVLVFLVLLFLWVFGGSGCCLFCGFLV